MHTRPWRLRLQQLFHVCAGHHEVHPTVFTQTADDSNRRWHKGPANMSNLQLALSHVMACAPVLGRLACWALQLVMDGAGKDLRAGLAAHDCAVLLLQQRAQLVLVQLLHQRTCAAAAASAIAAAVALAVLWITVCWAIYNRLLWLLLLVVGLVQRLQCLFLHSLQTHRTAG